VIKQADGTAPAIHIKGRKDVHESWHVPTLLMDATMQPDIVRLFWPTMELTADIRVLTPHQHIAQVCDRSYALSQLRRDSGFRDVHGILCRHARQYAPRSVLAVVQVEIEEKLLEVGNLPANLKMAHHNNIAGRDEWGDVASLVVVGRTEPSPRAAEWQAEAITGIAIDPLPGYYEKAPAWREMADGTFHPAEATRHPDPIAEAVRWHIAVGELIQILGRPRGVNEQDHAL
jgi:putative DNA primase/helicase